MTCYATTDLEEVAGGSAHEFKWAATLDGEPYDLTGLTVSVVFRSPAGTLTTKTATITDAANGEAHYVTAATDLVPTGRRERWTRAWKITQGGVPRYSLPVPFWLVQSP